MLYFCTRDLEFILWFIISSNSQVNQLVICLGKGAARDEQRLSVLYFSSEGGICLQIIKRNRPENQSDLFQNRYRRLFLFLAALLKSHGHVANGIPAQYSMTLVPSALLLNGRSRTPRKQFPPKPLVVLGKFFIQAADQRIRGRRSPQKRYFQYNKPNSQSGIFFP